MTLALQVGGIGSGGGSAAVLTACLGFVLLFAFWTFREMARAARRRVPDLPEYPLTAMTTGAPSTPKTPEPFGLKAIIRGVREPFPLASFNFQSSSLVRVDIRNEDGQYHRITVLPCEDGTFQLQLLLNTWGDGTELSHWDVTDNITLEIMDDLVGWLSCVRADIPADGDLPDWDEKPDVVCHLPRTSRMCWAEFQPSERFPVVQLHGTVYQTSNSKWKILFLRPGESRAYILNNQGHPLKHTPEALIREIEHAANMAMVGSRASPPE